MNLDCCCHSMGDEPLFDQLLARRRVGEVEVATTSETRVGPIGQAQRSTRTATQEALLPVGK
eukprot:4640640-Pleurochrysis_carterae.AAC.1